MNKETVEEVAEKKYTPGVYVINGIDICEAARECFIEGAKWQAEKMYSEEEVNDILQDWSLYCSITILEEHVSNVLSYSEWFEQFKKKV
jgi:hypothetical protein